MTPEIYKSVIQNVGSEPVALKQLHAAARDAGSSWSIEQLHLMLDCMDGIEVTQSDATWMVHSGSKSPEEELADAIAETVQSQGGRPLPAAMVLELLPARFTTSEAQIRKVAKESARLQVMGPGMIGLAR